MTRSTIVSLGAVGLTVVLGAVWTALTAPEQFSSAGLLIAFWLFQGAIVLVGLPLSFTRIMPRIERVAAPGRRAVLIALLIAANVLLQDLIFGVISDVGWATLHGVYYQTIPEFLLISIVGTIETNWAASVSTVLAFLAYLMLGKRQDIRPDSL